MVHDKDTSVAGRLDDEPCHMHYRQAELRPSISMINTFQIIIVFWISGLFVADKVQYLQCVMTFVTVVIVIVIINRFL